MSGKTLEAKIQGEIRKRLKRATRRDRAALLKKEGAQEAKEAIAKLATPGLQFRDSVIMFRGVRLVSKSIVALLLALLLPLTARAQITVSGQLDTSAGTHAFTAPQTGVYSIECWGAGANGNSTTGHGAVGGGGGGYSIGQTILTKSSTYYYQVGAGGGQCGSITSSIPYTIFTAGFNSAGGPPPATAGVTGTIGVGDSCWDISHSGSWTCAVAWAGSGNGGGGACDLASVANNIAQAASGATLNPASIGGSGGARSGAYGGGGGGCAGVSGSGGIGGTSGGSLGGTGGTGANSNNFTASFSLGGSSTFTGSGGSGGSASGGTAQNGSIPGGGGGGAYTNSTVGLGANGAVRITWTPIVVPQLPVDPGTTNVKNATVYNMGQGTESGSYTASSGATVTFSGGGALSSGTLALTGGTNQLTGSLSSGTLFSGTQWTAGTILSGSGTGNIGGTVITPSLTLPSGSATIAFSGGGATTSGTTTLIGASTDISSGTGTLTTNSTASGGFYIGGLGISGTNATNVSFGNILGPGGSIVGKAPKPGPFMSVEAPSIDWQKMPADHRRVKVTIKPDEVKVEVQR